MLIRSRAFCIQSLRAFRRAVLFGLFAWWVVGLLSLGLSVCSFERGASCAHFGSLSWGPLGFHFGSSGDCLVTILRSLGALGIHFRVLGSSLRLHFWGSVAPLVPLGFLGGSLGAPLAAQGAQSEIILLFSFYFGVILDSFWR